MRQVARELKLSHVWSWGWAQRDARSNDPDKTYAACVWLWARDARLCDAPALLGRELDADRQDRPAQPAGRDALRVRTTPLTASSVAALAKVTTDRELALTALVVRAVERERARVSPSDALALERRIVRVLASAAACPRTARAGGGGREPGGRDARISATSCGAREIVAPARGSRGSRRRTSRASARPSRPCSRAR